MKYSHIEVSDETISLHSDTGKPLSLQKTGEKLQGELNDNTLLVDENRKKYILRQPIADAPIIPYINEDLTESGFIKEGGDYKLTSLLEQVEFINLCAELGLPVVVPIFCNQELMISPFIESTPYHLYLLNGQTEQIVQVLSENMRAHQFGVVYSDRWGPNTLIDQKNAIHEIDFDLKLLGKWLQEFELAQVAYHTVHFSTEKTRTIGLIAETLLANGIYGNYDLDHFFLFLLGHAQGRKDHAYAGILNDIRAEIDSLIELIRK